MLDIMLRFLGWLGILAALAVAAIAVFSVLAALVYMALSPLFYEIAEWRRHCKIVKATARYARRFPVLLVLAAIGTLSSCASPVLYTHSSDALDGLPAVSSLAEAWRITSRIVYDGSLDCKTPAQTYREGHGDCKDISALMVALLESAGIEADLVRIRMGDGQHMIVRIDGYSYVEPQDYGAYYDEADLDIVCYYTLDEYLGGAI